MVERIDLFIIQYTMSMHDMEFSVQTVVFVSLYCTNLFTGILLERIILAANQFCFLC